MVDLKPYAATDENIEAYALEPAMRWLISVALDGSTITYGELKVLLETKAGFATIFPTRIGYVAGVLMSRIQDSEPNAPLINTLVVNQNDGQPSEGAGSFMARRFGEPRLNRSDAKQVHPKLWRTYFNRAAEEVYRISAADWARLFSGVFGQSLSVVDIKKMREDRQNGTEHDGIGAGRSYGKGGEGPNHKALRLWVKENPHQLHQSFSQAVAETEVDLDSADRVDVVYKCSDRIIVIEVKSSSSNELDLRRGVFQCIKYRAVRTAMDLRLDPLVEAWLVTETELPGQIASLLKRHNIRHFKAPLDRD